jgi:hypothetical protein
MMELEEETSDHQRSIILVNILNAIGFSNSERGIHRHIVLLYDLLEDIFQFSHQSTVTIAGSRSEGICGGIYRNEYEKQDIDLLFTATNIKLYTPGGNDIKYLLPCYKEDYGASFCVKEDATFPGYVKLQLEEVQINSFYFCYCSRLHENEMYLSCSMIMDYMYEELAKPPKQASAFPLPGKFDQYRQSEINGPAHTIYTKDYFGHSTQADKVYCIHYDTWPNSAKEFISRRKPNNWPSNNMLGHIKSQGCDVIPVGHHDSNNNDIQWRISFRVNEVYF